MGRTAGVSAVLIVMVLSFLSGIVAAQGKQAEAAPIPTQIAAAKRVFIANGGGDEPSFQDPFFEGGVDRAYNKFYAAMKSTGRHELVGSPAEADLLFNIRFVVPPAPVDVTHGNSLTPVYDPQFHLEIRDPKSNALLWAFTEHMQWAILQGNRNKNFDQAIARIVADVQNLVTHAMANASAAKS